MGSPAHTPGPQPSPLADHATGPGCAADYCPPVNANSGEKLTLHRHPERGRPERAELDAILDAHPVGTLSTVVDGRPWVVPMLFARDGDRLILHGSTGAGALRQVAAGSPAALCVTLLDGVVVAGSTFACSANYRSAVVHGTLTPLQGPEKAQALDALSDRLIPGRVGEVRAMTDKELAATLAMTLPIVDGQWIAKVRTGPPGSPEPGGGVWEGVVPVRLTADDPQPAPWITDQAVPDSVARLRVGLWEGAD